MLLHSAPVDAATDCNRQVPAIGKEPSVQALMNIALMHACSAHSLRMLHSLICVLDMLGLLESLRILGICQHLLIICTASIIGLSPNESPMRKIAACFECA